MSVFVKSENPINCLADSMVYPQQRIPYQPTIPVMPYQQPPYQQPPYLPRGLNPVHERLWHQQQRMQELQRRRMDPQVNYRYLPTLHNIGTSLVQYRSSSVRMLDPPEKLLLFMRIFRSAKRSS